jgi:hypothetical protein
MSDINIKNLRKPRRENTINSQKLFIENTNENENKNISKLKEIQLNIKLNKIK